MHQISSASPEFCRRYYEKHLVSFFETRCRRNLVEKLYDPVSARLLTCGLIMSVVALLEALRLCAI